MPRFILHAVGRDRPGIVAQLARGLAELGCNLEDSRMAMLADQFAVMLVFDAPEISDGTVVEHQLAPVAEQLDLLVAVRPLAAQSAEERSGPNGPVYAVSVHGADHPGIVARISEEVAACGGNVVDLASHVVEARGQASQASYVMVLTVAMPEGDEGEALRASLQQAAADLDVRCVVGPADADLL